MQNTNGNLSLEQVNTIPSFQAIEFSNEDLQSNALGILTDAQKQALYILWYKKNVNPIFVMLIVLPFASAFGKFIVQIHFVIAIITIFCLLWIIKLIHKRIHETLKSRIVEDIKIKSFTGTARPYQNDSGWYLAFDEVMTFEIKDQPNKLFKPEHKYRVFMTDKDKIIIGARLLDS